ncbi:MAG: GntR family transcriptional regulator [Burkholderiaceae bacterium]
MLRPVASARPSITRRASLSTRAYEELRERVRRGLISPDERLVDVDIASQLEVSRMPVREALLQLVAEGHLVSTARGYRIPTLSRSDVTEIFEVRRLLEPRAAALAARDLTADAARRLGDALAQAHAAAANKDFAGLFHANLDFREAWLGAVRNTRLSATISRFVDHVQIVRFGTLHDPATQQVVVDMLTELHDAMVRHDSVMAHDLMARFIDAAERSFATHAARED